MKTILLLTLFVCFLFIDAFASPADTTFKAVLNEGGSPLNISVTMKQYPAILYNEGDPYETTISVFTLTVEGKSFSDTLPYEDSFGVEIVDINSKDKSKEILISSGGSPDYCYWVYKYSNGLVQLLKSDYYQEFIPDGSGTVTAVKWAGFCVLKDKFTLTKDGTKLEQVKIDFYPIKNTFEENGVEKDYKVTAVKSFNIYKDRFSNCKIKSTKVNNDIKYTVTGYDEMSVVTEIKKGEKVVITGYDTKYTTIKNSEGEETWWVWIQVKSAGGKTGWIFMNAYDQDYWNEFVEGVVFAG
jgi:hypothetical protein